MGEYSAWDFDRACMNFGATPDDVRRLIVLATQQNHLLVRGLRLGGLQRYATRICDSVGRIEEEAYLPGACSTKEQAMRRADKIRQQIVLSGPVSPDQARRVQRPRIG